MKKHFFLFSLIAIMMNSLYAKQLEEVDAVKDPFEKVNRTIFEFNMKLDTFFLKPISIGYQQIIPSVARTGVHNIFSNLAEVPNSANSVLQGKFKNAGKSIGRFVVNFTLGFFFMFDVASELGLRAAKEDFGQTLARWGVPQGPYIVAPFLGPFTVRSGAGAVMDIFVFDPIFVENVATRNTLFSIRTVDTRTALLGAEQLIIGDPYVFIRNLYLQQRDFEVNDGDVKDAFGESELSDDDWLE